MNKQLIKRLKRIGLLLVLVLNISNAKAITMNMIENTYTDYKFSLNNKEYDLVLYENKSDHTPLFKLEPSKKQNSYDGYMTQEEYGVCNDDIIHNAIYLTTKGNVVKEENFLRRVAVQYYIYERFAQINSLKFTILTHEEEIKKLQEEIIKESSALLQTDTLNYNLTTDTWQTIDLGLYQTSDYNFLDIETDNIKTNQLDVKSREAKKYIFEPTVKEKKKKTTYYIGTSQPTYLYVSEPKIKNPTLIFETKEKNYNIKIVNQNGITIKSKTTGIKNENIKIDYDLAKGYSLKQINVTSASNKKIIVKDNSFIMPNEDVVITAIINKNTYNINTQLESFVKLNIKKQALYLETVSFDISLPSNLVLDKVTVLADNKEIEVKNNSFIMPSSDILIIVKTKPKLKNITIIENDLVKLNNLKSATVNELVVLNPIVQDGYLLDEIIVLNSKNEKIPLKDNTFIMPDDDVTISITTKIDKKITIQKTTGISVTYDTLYDELFSKDYIILNAKLDEDYEFIAYLTITKSGQLKYVYDNVIERPNESITIIPIVKKDAFNVYLVDKNFHTIATLEHCKYGKIIKIPHYNDYERFVFPLEIQIINDSFVMPNNDLYIYGYENSDDESLPSEKINKYTFLVKEKKEEEVQPEPIVFENIPNTLKNKWPFLEIIICINGIYYVKKKFSF